LTPPASQGGSWIETVLHSFTGGADGEFPSGPVAIGEDGVLFGTTTAGGTRNLGTVFAVTPPASPSGSWTETVLHSFIGGGDDGYAALSGVVIGKNGVLYGTTLHGGLGFGTVFTLIPPEGGPSTSGRWKETCSTDSQAAPQGSAPSRA